MLHVLWRTMDSSEKITFLDGSEQYYIPRLKLEKSVDGVLELLSTTSDIYRPVEDCFLEYAYHNGIRELSDSICYSYTLDVLSNLDAREGDVPGHLYDKHKERLSLLESKTKIHINQIKENHDKQRENC